MKVEIKNNTIIVESMHNTHKFEIVEKIPSGYVVWNIGENMGTDEYIPMAMRLSYNKNEDNYHCINADNLKAIKLPAEEVKALRNAAHNGISCLADAEKAIKSTHKGYWSDKKREHATKTIDIFRRITI